MEHRSGVQEESKSVKRIALSKHLVLLSLIVVCAAICYSNSLGGEFCFDDHFAVVRNTDVNPSSPVMEMLHHDFWGADISRDDSHKSYRPLCTLSFRWNRQLFSTPEDINSTETPQHLSTAFHKVNFFLHVAVCLMVYGLSFIVFESDGLTAVLSGLIFASHPIHVEAVTGIVGRSELLCAIFCLAAYFVYSWTVRLSLSKSSSVIKSITCTVSFGAALILASCAILSKETGFTIFAVMVAHELLLVPRNVSHLPSIFDRPKWPFLRNCSIVCAFAVVVLVCRKLITVSMVLSNYRHLENPIAYTSGWQLIYNIAMLHTKYFQLLVYPSTMSPDYSFNCLPLVEKLYDIRNLYSLLLFLFLANLGLLCLRHINEGRRWLFLLLWFGVFALPSSNIFFFVGTMVGERLLYSPSIPFSIMIARATSQLVHKFRQKLLKALPLVITVTLILTYGRKTFLQNKVWADDATLFAHAEQVCPSSAKVQYILGTQALHSENFQTAITHFQRALQIEPIYCDVWHSLGISYWRLSDFKTGLQFMRQGLDCKYTEVVAAESLHTIYTELLKYNPRDTSSITGLAELFERVNLTQQAAKYYINAATILSEKKDHESSVSYSRKALLLAPYDCEAQYFAARCFQSAGNEREAIIHYTLSSWEHNCSNTYYQSMDALVGIYQQLLLPSRQHPQAIVPASIREEWEQLLPRALAAKASLEQKQKLITPSKNT
ncbi:protein O-mannosyl-transferase TMTC1 [Pelomyxa schiedti]|nr:protein O-mannosyl-transferase TMTC1 [Pelomyxa schiedti]